MDKLNEALEVLIEILKSTKDFVGDQAPKVAQEIISYEIWSALIWALLGVGLAYFFFWSFKRLRMLCEKERDTDYNIAATFMMAFCLLSLVFTGVCVDSLLKAKLAPTVTVIDYLQGKLSSGCKK